MPGRNRLRRMSLEPPRSRLRGARAVERIRGKGKKNRRRKSKRKRINLNIMIAHLKKNLLNLNLKLGPKSMRSRTMKRRKGFKKAKKKGFS